MRLYLSSYRIPVPEALAELVGKPLQGMKMALIPNAKDYYSEIPRHYKIGDFTQYVEALGVHVTVVDLREYRDAALLRERLAAADLVWVAGGNTFCLRYEMRRSGFDEAIARLLKYDTVVYGGESAGAIAAGMSLRGIEAADPPQFARETIYEGLGLVPYMILPHVGNPGFADLPEEVRSRAGKASLVELTDAQVAVFQGGAYHISSL